VPTSDVPFPLGRVVATPGALRAFELSADSPLLFLVRHQNGDWGDLTDEDKQRNEEALREGSRLLSAYHLWGGTRIWIITEADRSSTCILLPTDY
jgi:hypothetical protein